MTTTPTHCLECNAPLSPAETQGLCARCLLKMGLASQFGESSVADAGARKFIPPPMFPFDFGGYRVQRLLGRGGMGAVYEAEQHGTGRRVALKVLGHTIDSPEMRKRFLREGRLAASVNHPNSVYIFGTEEIEGAPVIAMELVAGGTLRDRIRKGPLPVREAVDAILQIIAGLEAAANAGVLHRDVKPANCFVAPDGTAKVGDFGLSVSTLAHQDTQLTASGVMLGTPSFAPPEQLRGDELDVRADIYSVGATLYALLTGKAPFEGENAVQVVAAVLDGKPKPIAELRKDVPPGLAQVIASCLAKKREERIVTYARLRDFLLPYSSAVPDPAPLGLRFFAGVIDEAFAGLPGTIALLVAGLDLADSWLLERTPQTLLIFLAGLLAYVFYYAIAEGLAGCAIGKAICRLRVIGPDGSAPGIRRAFARASITGLALISGTLLTALVVAKNEYVPDGGHWTGFVFIPLWWALFTTMRRRNGFATVHDLATSTRVVVRQKSVVRVKFDVPAEAAPADDAARLGPYLLAGEGIGYDPALRRRVWLRKSAAPAGARRDLARPGRLRWLGEVEGVQVFESPGGGALREVLAHSQPWGNVRQWLADLALEFDAAAKDGTLPATCGLANVWIAASGRAVLLDKPLASEESPAFDASTPAGAQQFLDAVAGHALDRRAVPLHAREFLEKIAGGAFDRLSFIAGNLQSLLARPAEVSRERRAASIFAAPAFWLVMSIFMVFLARNFFRDIEKIERQHPGFADVPTAIAVYDAALQMTDTVHTIGREERDPRLKATMGALTVGATLENSRASAARFISYRAARLIRDPRFDEITREVLDASQRALARRAVAEFPEVTPEEFSAAALIVHPMISETRSEVSNAELGIWIGPGVFLGGLIAMALIHFASVLLFATGPGLRMLGLAVVDRTGRPAGRLHLLGRGVIAWLPFSLTALACFAILQLESTDTKRALLAASLILGSLTLLGALWSALHPVAGPHDRLTGTRVVPR